MTEMDPYIEKMVQYGLGQAIRRYYGFWRAIVVDNKDPAKLGRVRAVCPEVGQRATGPDDWVLPGFPGAGNRRGMFYPPEEDDTIWVTFFEGDPSVPQFYLGGWYGEPNTPGTSDVPDPLGYSAATGHPEKKGIVTRAGHALIFNDEAGKESVVLIWNSPAADDPATSNRRQTAKLNPDKSAMLAFDKNGGVMVKTSSKKRWLQIDEEKGTITIQQADGTSVFLAANGSINLNHKSGASIALSDAAISITAAVSKGMPVNISGATVNINGSILLGGQAAATALPPQPAVLGEKLIEWLVTHTHTTTAPGSPTSPPLTIPALLGIVSKTVLVAP